MFSSLRLVLIDNSLFRKIHYFSFPPDSSVNDCIPKKTVHLHYMILDNMIQKVMAARRHFVIIKCNIKDNFCNIPLALHIQWLLGFYWRVCFYTKNRLSFGLSILFFIFNMFTEAFYWIFQSFLGWDLEYYLDNYVAFISVIKVIPDRIWIKSDNYARLTDIFRISWLEIKDLEEMVVSVFGIKVDTNLFTLRLLCNKLYKEGESAMATLIKWSMMLLEM